MMKPKDRLTDSAQVLRGMIYYLAAWLSEKEGLNSPDWWIEDARKHYQDGLNLAEDKAVIVNILDVVWYVNPYYPDYEMRLDGDQRVSILLKSNRAPVRPIYQDGEPVKFKLLARDGKMYYHPEILFRRWLEELDEQGDGE